MLLEVDKLTVGFKLRKENYDLIREVSFCIQSGEIMGLVGESGSGKTLTASALSGLLPPPLEQTGGRIIFQGKEIISGSGRQWEALRGSNIFYLFQSPLAALNPTLKVGRQIGEALKEHFNLGRKTSMNQTASLLEEVGIPSNKAGGYPFELSGGMRQRVLIALALGLHPRLLIADEPFSGLDGVHEKEILDLLEKLHCRGTAILVISHDLRLIAGWADRVAVMVNGVVVEEISGNALFQEARHPYTQSLVESMIRLEKALDPSAVA
jgi:ABC-type dipeptide/oligopeptide/nickel transport system ATPase component